MISDIICSKENNCFLGKALWANKTQCPGYFYIQFVACKGYWNSKCIFSHVIYAIWFKKETLRELRQIQIMACSSNKQKQNNVIFIFFAKSVACPTSSSNSSGGRANSVKIAARWCAVFWFWDWSTCYSLMLTRPS